MQSSFHKQHPLRWPLVLVFTLASLLAFVFLVPAEWINRFFSPLGNHPAVFEKKEDQWLVILPPVELESVAEIPEKPETPEPAFNKPPPASDPGWWTAAWEIKSDTAAGSIFRGAETDSVIWLLQTLGVGLDFTQRALPDSLLDYRLQLLRIEDGFEFEELKPYLSALGRARALADKQSREAAMYDEHLGSTIMVPD